MTRMNQLRGVAWRVMALLVVACGPPEPAPASDALRSEASGAILPADPVEIAEALGVAPDSLRAAGEERYGRQEYDSARAILTAELIRARGMGDGVAEARAAMWLGLASWRLGDYPAARAYGESSLVQKRRFGLDGELSRSFNALGLLAWNEGRHGEALVRFDSALAAARRHDDAAMLARAAANIPLVQVELGEFAAARQGLLLARDAARAIGDQRTQANALANLAMLEIRLGSPRSALPLLAEARRHYIEIEYATGEANVWGQLATAWSALGELQQAIIAADSALAIARRHGLQQEVAANLEVLADLHLQGGSSRLALQRLREADSLDERIGLTEERGNNLRRESAILLELGDAATALARADEALAVFRAGGIRGEMVAGHLQRARVLAVRGEVDAARREADVAMRLARDLDSPLLIRDSKVESARLALDAEDPKRALRLLGIPDPDDATPDWRLHDLRATAFLTLGRLDEARTAGETAVALVERERASLGVGPLRSKFLEGRVGPYARLVAIHLARGDTSRAFEIAAGVPGRGLAERVTSLDAGAGAVGSLAEGERLLLNAAAIETELAKAGAGPAEVERRDHLVRALVASRLAYEEHVAHNAPTPAERILGVGRVRVAEVSNRLAGDEVLLLYLAGPAHLDLFVLRQGRVVHHSIPITTEDLLARVRLTRGLLRVHAGQGATQPASLGVLHDLLIAPAFADGVLEGVTRLLIVPHGSLVSLPFSALWNRRTGRYLIEDWDLAYLPAVAALEAPDSRSVNLASGLAIFAPLPDSLPGTAREARSLAQQVREAELHLGRSSNETVVRAALGRGRVLHLASHGFSNPQNPIFSRLVVGRSAVSAPSDRDGRLEVHEILGLRTTSPLVFLSGCETGLGSAAQAAFGEGSDEGSLAHAFLAAGVGSVVATLWRVNDADAADLAERFYRHLGAGEAPDRALARAQRESLGRGGALTWAAYGVFGAGSRKSDGARRVMVGGP